MTLTASLKEFQEGREPVGMRFYIETGPLTHNVGDGIEAFGWQLGLDIDRRVTGGWLTKTHWFRVKGEAPQLLELARYVDGLVDRMEEEDD